uniref:Uncharacterized protein n=1 Tax=Romanomermis culicivorax TaxID=13658 RepID=A0A915J724_ROMCU
MCPMSMFEKVASRYFGQHRIHYRVRHTVQYRRRQS